VIETYTIAVIANPTAGGSVAGGGTYNYNQNCTVTATPNTGYDFVNWTENGTQVSTSPTYNFTVTSNRNLVANFVIETYTIAVIANPTAGGSVAGGGTYNYNQNCTVTATPNTGYDFVNWTENGSQVSTSPTYNFTVTSNRNLVANFVIGGYTITVTANPPAGGAVGGGGTYNYNQNCTVTATPNTGYDFVNWTENGSQVSTSPTYNFTVTSNRNLVANFVIETYTITVTANPPAGGTVEGGGTYNYNHTLCVMATANTGYNFVNWTENGNVVSTSPSYCFTVTSNRNLFANFEVQTFTITTSSNPSNGGSTSGGGTYNYGQPCTVSATTNPGYTFVNWTENGNVVSLSSNYSFVVISNRNLVANFQQIGIPIMTSSNPTNGGVTSGGGIYFYNQSCTVIATPNTGYDFINWTENGTVASTSHDYTFIVTSARNLVANFVLETYTITVTANPPAGGTVGGGGIYNYNQNCTVTATPNTGYDFVNWTENGSQVSSSATYSFVVNANRNLTANFELGTAYSENIIKDEDLLNLFPNPVSGSTINIEINETLCTENHVISIYNVYGSLRSEFKNNNDLLLQVNVSSFGSGMYIMKYQSASHVISKTFIIK
jgi:hypothetical protein